MQKTYLSKINLPDCDKGTKFFYQDGLYYYKTRTEMDAWLSKEYVEGNAELFDPMKKENHLRQLVKQRRSAA